MNKVTVQSFDKEQGQWIPIELKDLKDGDIFIMFYGDKRHSNPNTDDNVWIAKGEPYIDPQYNVWAIQTLF